jgi:hypothetical protein
MAALEENITVSVERLKCKEALALLQHDYSSFFLALLPDSSTSLHVFRLLALVSIFDRLIFNLVSLDTVCPIFDWLILALDSSV